MLALNSAACCTGVYVANRAVAFMAFNMEPGTYVLIPSTFDSNKECSILISTVASYPVTVNEISGAAGVDCRGDHPIEHTSPAAVQARPNGSSGFSRTDLVSMSYVKLMDWATEQGNQLQAAEVFASQRNNIRVDSSCLRHYA